jgi:hypothetical protein
MLTDCRYKPDRLRACKTSPQLKYVKSTPTSLNCTTAVLQKIDPSAVSFWSKWQAICRFMKKKINLISGLPMVRQGLRSPRNWHVIRLRFRYDSP